MMDLSLASLSLFPYSNPYMLSVKQGVFLKAFGIARPGIDPQPHARICTLTTRPPCWSME